MTSTNDEPKTSVGEEIKAMQRIVAVLGSVDACTQDRIASWLYDRYHADDALDQDSILPNVGGQWHE